MLMVRRLVWLKLSVFFNDRKVVKICSSLTLNHYDKCPRLQSSSSGPKSYCAIKHYYLMNDTNRNLCFNRKSNDITKCPWFESSSRPSIMDVYICILNDRKIVKIFLSGNQFHYYDSPRL